MARDFNGSTDRIDYSSAWDPSGNDCTVSAWVYPDDITAGDQYIWTAHPSGDASYGIALWIKSNYIAFLRNWSTNWERRSRYGAGALASGSWQHVVATSTSTGLAANMELYVDGSVPGSTSTDTGSGSENSHDGSWSIGGRIYDNNRNFNGRICEVGVWDRILAAGEIAALAKGYAPSFFPRGLMEYLPLVGRKDTGRVSGNTPTYDGTSVAVHPRILYPG